MNVRIRGAALVLLAVSALVTGAWACFAPHGWYLHFPGFGRHWVSSLGPYNEHLARDAGAMFLALAVLSVFALARLRDDGFARATGVVWLVFNVPHLVFHLRHLGMYDRTDQVLNAVGLPLAVLLSAVLLVPSGRRQSTAGRRE